MTKLAAIQMASGPNVQANLDEAERLIANAASQSASLVVLPENFAYMGKSDEERLRHVESPGEGPIQQFLSTQAKKHGLWIVGGTMPLVADTADKALASCLVYDSNGDQAARYDKIHLFDVHIEESNESYNESATTQPGSTTTIVETPFGKLGLAICYDLRFPELFRSLVNQGMEICAMPASFTAQTGKAHWDVLVRARAIENLSYMVAAGQGGYHVSGRETYGHSMVVDPWGVVMNHQGKGAGVIIAEMDIGQLHKTREHFPVLEHQRLSCHIEK